MSGELFTVRKLVRGHYLFRSELGWNWHIGKRTPMPREEAEEKATRLGGVVCDAEGKPIGKTPAKRPKSSRERAPGEPLDKATRLRALVAAEDWPRALKLAASLPRLGDDKTTLQRAYEANARPTFTRQLKRDPEALVAAGIEVLKRRWGSGD